jgi:hypothetical protein
VARVRMRHRTGIIAILAAALSVAAAAQVDERLEAGYADGHRADAQEANGSPVALESACWHFGS